MSPNAAGAARPREQQLPARAPRALSSALLKTQQSHAGGAAPHQTHCTAGKGASAGQDALLTVSPILPLCLGTGNTGAS